jgi:hypothetical protein
MAMQVALDHFDKIVGRLWRQAGKNICNFVQIRW